MKLGQFEFGACGEYREWTILLEFITTSTTARNLSRVYLFY